VSEQNPLDADRFGPGAQIAGYRLEEQIGSGGMAVVYRAHDIRLDRSVALKILAPELARDRGFRQRFIRESRAAAAVDHPNIIPIFEAGEASGVLFIAMRYVQGRDVRTLLDREGTLPAAHAAYVIAQMASALDAAHARGLVHRDVKPANMLLDEAAGSGQRDHIYLSDFGLSKQSLAAADLTSAGQFLGTLDYVAPEQIEGRPVDGRADLYSLACAAFEMLSGAPPFNRDQRMAVLWAQLSESPPRLSARRPDLPPAVDEVMAKALAKSPVDRYAKCMDFAVALRAACGLAPDDAAGSRTRPAPAQTRVTPPRPSRSATEVATPARAAGTAERSGADSGTAGSDTPEPGHAVPGIPAAGFSAPDAPVPDVAAGADAAVPGAASPVSAAAPEGAEPGSDTPGSDTPGSTAGTARGGWETADRPPTEPAGGPSSGRGPRVGGGVASGEGATEAVGLPPVRPAGPGRQAFAGREAAARREAAPGREPAGWEAAAGEMGAAREPSTGELASAGQETAPGRPAGSFRPASAGPPHQPLADTAGTPPPGRPWIRSRAALVAACAAVVGLGGAALAIHAAGGKGKTGQAVALTAPGCSTATAAAQPLAKVHRAMVALDGKPYAVAMTPNGRWTFVTLGQSVAVLRNSGSLAPSLVRTIAVPNANGESLTHDGRYLVVASGSGAFVLDVAKAEQGSQDAVMGKLFAPGGHGGYSIQVAVSPDDRFVFVTLMAQNRLAVFNLQTAFTKGFNLPDFVGFVPLGVKPVDVRVSSDRRWLYVTSETRTASTQQGTLAVLDLHKAETKPDSSVVATVNAGCSPVRAINSADGSVVWVTARASDEVLAFSGQKLLSDPQHALIARVRAGAAPVGLTFVNNGKRIVVANSNSPGVKGATSNLTVIDTAAALAGRPALLGVVQSGDLPLQFAVAPDGETLLVTNSDSRQLEAVNTGDLP
jgi:serine/threonine protein kinase/DNA-binding beta-propeller fold protein YncE